MFYDIQQSGHLWEVSLRYQSERADFDNLVSACKILGAEWRANTKKWYIASSKMASILQHANVFAKTSEQVMDVVRSKKMELDGAAKMDLSDPDALTPLRMREKGKKLKDYQIEAVKWISERESTLLADEMGLGKEVSIDTPILYEDGWRPIGECVVGDRVCGRDGKFYNVVGVYPQGVKDVFRVRFSDGTSILAGREHLWGVYTANDRRRDNPIRIKSTEELASSLQMIWSVPTVEPIEYPRSSLPIPAYILGVLIGDGSIIDSIRFVPGDSTVAGEVAKFMPQHMKLYEGADYGTSTAWYISQPGQRKNDWMEWIRSVGLNVSGDYKFIPEQYMAASIEDRKLLLSGLMDTDGTCVKNKAGKKTKLRYYTVSERLARNVADLVRSLGGIASVGCFEKVRDNEKPVWVVYFSIVGWSPFRVKHQDHVIAEKFFKPKTIRSIEPEGQAECICIAVDSPGHLYLADGYTLTHNTVMSAACLNACPDFKKALVICPANLKQNWFNELKDWMVDTSRSIGIVSGSYWPPTDVVIINYDVLDRHKGKLDAITWDFIFQDECHYIKSTKAKRTKAIIGGKIRKKKRGKKK